MEKRLHIDKFKILVLAILLFLSFVYTRNLLFRTGTLACIDWSIPPEMIQLIKSFNQSFYSWRNFSIFTGMGANPLWLSGIHQTTINAIFGYLGVSGAIYSKLSVFAILFIIGLSAYLLFIKFNVSKFAAIFGSVIYMSSPLLFNWINMVGSYAHTSCYAFLPLSFFLFLKALESHHWQVYAILITFSMIHTSPVFGFALSMMIIIPYSFMLILFNNDRKDKIKRVSRSLLLIFILFFLLESFWLIPAILHGSEELAAIRPQDWGGLKYKIVDSLRLWGFYLPEYESISLNSIFKGFPAFFLPILAFSSILFYKSEQKKNILFFSIYSICIIFFASSSFSIYLIRKNIFFLGIFRDISKILIILSLCLSLLSAFALNEIHKRMKSFKKNILAKIILLIILAIYIFPYLSGNFGGRMISSNIFPKDYNEISNWLQKQPEDFKVLWIPTGAVYLQSKEVGKDVHVADFFGIYSPKPGVIGEIVYRYKLIPEYWVSNYFYDNNLNNSENISRVLGLFNVKYLIVRKNDAIINWMTTLHSQAWNRGLKERLPLENIGKSPGLSLIKETANIAVYENKSFIPHIYPVRDLIITSGGLYTLTPLIKSFESEPNQQAFIFANQLRDANIIKKVRRITIANGNITDLLIPFFKKNFIIDPGKFTLHQELSSGWSSFHQWYWADNQNYQQALEDIVWVKNGKATMTIPDVSIPERGFYELWAKVYFSPRASSLTFTISALSSKEYESNKATINIKTDNEEGFKWLNINNSLFLQKGNYTIRVFSPEGENVLARILLIPKGEYERAYQKFKMGLK